MIRIGRLLLFLAWAATGGALALAAITPFTIGVFVAPLALIALVALVLTARNESAAGALCGPAVLILYIGYLNRGGPGEVCTSTATSQSCTTEWNPWPFAVIGLLLLAAGVALFWHLN
ncbi:MAG: hypothetical protein JWO63_2951, partial [Frankiales bacterium]|nr:hypothetical protein [Frankiales bacterium]